MNPFSNILAQTSGALNKCNIIENKENDNVNAKKVASSNTNTNTNSKPSRKSSIIPTTPSTVKKSKGSTNKINNVLPKSALKSNVKRYNDNNNIVKIRRNLTPENEVMVLVARLKQLVGDFNDSVILEKLHSNSDSNSDSNNTVLFRSPTRVVFDNIDKNVDVIISPNISNLKSNSNSNDDNDDLISYFMDGNAYDDTDVSVKYNNRVSEIAPIRSWQTRYKCISHVI